MTTQYVSKSLVGIDYPDDKSDSGVSTAWYEDGVVISDAHAEAAGEENLKKLIANGSVVAQTIKEREEAAPQKVTSKE